MIPTKNLDESFHAGADSSIPRSRTGSSKSGAAMIGLGADLEKDRLDILTGLAILGLINKKVYRKNRTDSEQELLHAGALAQNLLETSKLQLDVSSSSL